MVKLEVKNIKEIENENAKQEFLSKCEDRKSYLEDYFKNYGKDLTLEVIVNKSGKTYKVSASLNMKSKKILHLEEHKDILPAATKLFNEFLKEVKRQKELERKDYLYKRKR